MSRPSLSCYVFAKRTLDVVVAGTLLIAVAPLMAAIGVMIRLVMGGPVFFTQVRVGRWGEHFLIYKFRTMNNPARASQQRPPRDEDRLAPIGRWLRRLSLDELPQLWNVLRGDMSLVGPRPLLEHYTEWFTPRERTRLAVRPGMTGWAQVNGRTAVPWDQRLEMDAWYVDERRFLLDVKILALTALQLIHSLHVCRGSDAMPIDDLDVERRLKRDSTI